MRKIYSKSRFDKDFPNDDACLDLIFHARYDNTPCKGCGLMNPVRHKVNGRKDYFCTACCTQVSPLANTIFHKSSTPLSKWFFAIYLFSQSKNGVAAKELERHLGVTYKCAWRMAKQIRLLMAQDNQFLMGIVEADETYIGGNHKMDESKSSKIPVIGAAERGGRAKALVVNTASRITAERFIESSISLSAELHTDTSPIYHHVSKRRVHESINHSKGEYGRGDVTTNTIEGFWSQLKRSLDGTHHSVSPKYLQNYINERVFHYSHRSEPIFPILLELAKRPIPPIA